MNQTQLALTQYVVDGGSLPSSESQLGFQVGMILTSAVRLPVDGLPLANGAMTPVAGAFGDCPLYQVIGNRFGGDAAQFALPDLTGRTIVGGTSGAVAGDTLAMTYAILAESPYLPGGSFCSGMILPFAGASIGGSWLACDGALRAIADHPLLFDAIGTVFGGDGVTNFALPDMTGVTAVGVGTGQAGTVALGERTGIAGPALGLNALICTQGVYPVLMADGPAVGTTCSPFEGQVLFSASAEVPGGWALADGGWLDCEANMSLYSLIMNQFGGNGSGFALPDLRARAVTGA